MGTKVKLPSGAELDIGLLGSEEAWSVSQALINVVQDLPSGAFNGISFRDLMSKDTGDEEDQKAIKAMVLSMKGPICAILSSKVVRDEAKKCFAQCTVDGVKISSVWPFEKKEARQDYLPACFYALKENVSPFFGALSSFLQKS